MLPLRINARALREIEAAQKWWRDNREKASQAFEEDLDRALTQAREFPETGTRARGDVRRMTLPRVHYFLYYRVAPDDVVEVLALWHVRRGSQPY